MMVDIESTESTQFKSDSFDKVFCIVEITKNDDFEVEEFWELRTAIMDFVQYVADPMMLNPSFPPKNANTFRLMFETYKNAIDIIESFFHTEARLKDRYKLNIRFDDVTKLD